MVCPIFYHGICDSCSASKYVWDLQQLLSDDAARIRDDLDMQLVGGIFIENEV